LWRIKKAAQTEADYCYICEQVKAGKMEFWKVKDCYFVTCLELPQNELVMVCCEGKGLVNAMDAIRHQAAFNHYKTIRIHAFDIGMKRLLTTSGYDWKQAETVYRLEV
jgi:hypothetical protein